MGAFDMLSTALLTDIFDSDTNLAYLFWLGVEVDIYCIILAGVALPLRI